MALTSGLCARSALTASVFPDQAADCNGVVSNGQPGAFMLAPYFTNRSMVSFGRWHRTARLSGVSVFRIRLFASEGLAFKIFSKPWRSLDEIDLSRADQCAWKRRIRRRKRHPKTATTEQMIRPRLCSFMFLLGRARHCVTGLIGASPPAPG